MKSIACVGEGDEGEGKVVGVVRAGEGVAGEKRLSASEGCMRGLRTLIGETRSRPSLPNFALPQTNLKHNEASDIYLTPGSKGKVVVSGRDCLLRFIVNVKRENVTSMSVKSLKNYST